MEKVLVWVGFFLVFFTSQNNNVISSNLISKLILILILKRRDKCILKNTCYLIGTQSSRCDKMEGV